MNRQFSRDRSANLASSGTGTLSASGTRKVTPDFMRTLMGYYPDPADNLFRKHQKNLYKLMEIKARMTEMSVEYSVSDDTVTDEAILQSVMDRMIVWLRNNLFAVRPSSKVMRGFVVSWDPVDTQQSITQAEKQDPDSVAMRRLRSAQREAAFRSKTTSQSQQRDEDFLGDLLAAPSASVAKALLPMTMTPPRSSSSYYRHQEPFPEHVLGRSRQMAEHAAAVAGIETPSSKQQQPKQQQTTQTDAMAIANLHTGGGGGGARGGGTTTTSSSDEHEQQQQGNDEEY